MSEERAGQTPLSDRPIVAFTGPFGCGKTEVVINYALAAQRQGRASCIIDLDVITPYFRVGDYRDRLAKEGVHVIAPEGALASSELPALPPEIAAAISGQDMHVVLDVGGDPVGTRLLGTYAPQLAARRCDVWMVANPFRPSSNSPEGLAEQARAIEASSPLRLTGLVANPHLGPATEPRHLRSGWKQVRQAARLLRLTVVFFAVAEQFAEQAPASDVPLVPMHLMLRLPWQAP